jgi:hypothetical protein
MTFGVVCHTSIHGIGPDEIAGYATGTRRPAASSRSTYPSTSPTTRGRTSTAPETQPDSPAG